MSSDVALSSYRDAIAFYLRDDVSCALWELSNRRPLTFHYHSDADFRPHGSKAKAVTFHCLPSVEDFRRRISELTGHITSCGWPFFPFWNMHHAVNAPGKPDQPVGWDMRFEIDWDLAGSFQAVIPILAILEHYGVPALAKYSGHRSLHLTIPAEAFPSRMRTCPEQKEWTRTFESLGLFFCHFAPAFGKTGAAHLSKDLVLTAPYSLHRYHGLIGLPLQLGEAMTFSSDSARLDRFAGVTWTPSDLDDPGDHMVALLDSVDRSTRDPDAILRLAEEVFRGPRWAAFADAAIPADLSDPVTEALYAGLPAIHHPNVTALPPPTRNRLGRAWLHMDRADAKDIKFHRLAGAVDFAVGFEGWCRVRRMVAEFASGWVTAGLDASLARLLEYTAVSDEQPRAALAIRLLAMLPEPPDQLLTALRHRWQRAPSQPTPATAFLALSLAQLAPHCPAALDLLIRRADPAYAPTLRDALLQAGPWQAEKRPDLTVAVLSLVFGLPAVRSWAGDPTAADARAVATAVFGSCRPDGRPDQAKNLAKFRHAVARVQALLPSEPAQGAQ
jgi:hypothetical protein